jgi:hypothetical protein
MGKGKQISDRMRELILIELATNNNLTHVAGIFGIGVSTVQGIRDANKDKFEGLRNLKKGELIQEAVDWKRQFLKNAEESILKATGLAKQQIEEAQITKEHISLKDLAIYIGTLYDKRALSNGDPTTRGELTGKEGQPLIPQYDPSKLSKEELVTMLTTIELMKKEKNPLI